MTFLSNFTLDLDSFNGEREVKGMHTWLSLTIPSTYVDLEHSVVDSKASRTYVVCRYENSCNYPTIFSLNGTLFLFQKER